VVFLFETKPSVHNSIVLIHQVFHTTRNPTGSLSHGVVLEAEAQKTRIVAVSQRAAPEGFTGVAVEQDGAQALRAGVDSEDGARASAHVSFLGDCYRIFESGLAVRRCNLLDS